MLNCVKLDAKLVVFVKVVATSVGLFSVVHTSDVFKSETLITKIYASFYHCPGKNILPLCCVKVWLRMLRMGSVTDLAVVSEAHISSC